jgi:hypothetical protein
MPAGKYNESFSIGMSFTTLSPDEKRIAEK